MQYSSVIYILYGAEQNHNGSHEEKIQLHFTAYQFTKVYSTISLNTLVRFRQLKMSQKYEKIPAPISWIRENEIRHDFCLFFQSGYHESSSSPSFQLQSNTDGWPTHNPADFYGVRLKGVNVLSSLKTVISKKGSVVPVDSHASDKSSLSTLGWCRFGSGHQFSTFHLWNH